MRLVNVIKSTVEEFSEDRCWTLSAALAFYAVFSLPWILLIIVYIAGAIVGEQAAAGQISRQLHSLTSPRMAREIENILQSASKPAGGVLATLVGIGAIIISSTTAFSELQFALNQAWEVEPADSGWKSFAVKRFTSFIMVIGIGILLLASMALGAVASAAGGALHLPFAGLLSVWQSLFTWGLVTVLVGAAFKVLPDAQIGWRDVFVGAIVTGALLVVGKYGMSMYLAHTSVGSTFGAAGSLAVLLLWLYYSAAIMLFGAEFTHEWSRSAGREVRPSKGAIRIGQRKKPAA